MQVAIHNIGPSSRQVSDEEFAALERQVADLNDAAAKVLNQQNLQKIVSEAIRPFAAEVALQEKETAQRNGMHVNRKIAGGFKLPKAD